MTASHDQKAKQMSFRNILGSLQEIGGLLVKRGTAMGLLIPSLVLCPVLLLFAWLLRSVAVVGKFPVISVALAIAALLVLVDYHRHYSRSASNDPDRLQSEEYRYQTTRLMIAANELPHSVPAEARPLAKPAANLAAPEVSAEEQTSPSDADEERAS